MDDDVKAFVALNVMDDGHQAIHVEIGYRALWVKLAGRITLLEKARIIGDNWPTYVGFELF
ncbi:hypothetical protein SAMCCGM7_Ch3428 [Sinorhizobium americanum CCGM7]|nr:hypothetical protein SAMCCGM7_Ch3428 [Sinorhizobium americanum CCGM7]